MAVGAALAARIQKSKRRVYVLSSDAECNEGSVWEAAMFAAHHRLDNLVMIVDSNRQQALGYTADVISLEPLEERWAAFGWDVHSVDGNDEKAISSAIAGLLPGKPHALIAHTTFGKGVSFMESQIRWHYLPMNDEQYALAIRELGV
jgi:transketolase